MYESLQTTDWNNVHQVLSTTAVVLAGALLAFNMEVMEFVVVTYTSSLTLSISGILKVKHQIQSKNPNIQVRFQIFGLRGDFERLIFQYFL